MDRKIFEEYVANLKVLKANKEDIARERANIKELCPEGIPQNVKNSLQDYIKSIEEESKGILKQQIEVLESIKYITDATIRKIFALKFLEGKTINEVCEELFISTRTLYRYIEKGFSMIEARINQEKENNDYFEGLEKALKGSI